LVAQQVLFLCRNLVDPATNPLLPKSVVVFCGQSTLGVFRISLVEPTVFQVKGTLTA
jgi:hypothetical protein